MKLKPLLLSGSGAMLFLAGVLIGLALSASVTWGETEADSYTSFIGDTRLSVKCPLMLSPTESGTIKADIINLTNEAIKPVVFAEISHAKAPRRIDQTIELGIGGSETVEWAVHPSDVIFERLILVNILQGRYRDNPSMLGSCGILLFSLFGLSGMATFTLALALSLAAMFSGGWLWLKAHQPLNHYSANLSRISGALMGMTVLALLSTFPRWWGLTLILDASILLVMGVIFTDFVLFSQKYKTG